MIGSLRGVLSYVGPSFVLVDVGGVGYRVVLPASSQARLPRRGEEVFLWVHTFVREDAVTLYGFMTQEELALFEEIIQVSGIGPRLALMILSTYPPADFRRLVAAGDSVALTRIPGVGKKTAQRLIFELRGKISPVQEEADAAPGLPRGAWGDALAALVSLGYAHHEAAAALRSVASRGEAGEGAEAAQLIKLALRELDRG